MSLNLNDHFKRKILFSEGTAFQIRKRKEIVESKNYKRKKMLTSKLDKLRQTIQPIHEISNKEFLKQYIVHSKHLNEGHTARLRRISA